MKTVMKMNFSIIFVAISLSYFLFLGDFFRKTVDSWVHYPKTKITIEPQVKK